MPFIRESIVTTLNEDGSAHIAPLGIIEQRCLLGVNGAEWFVGQMHRRTDMETYDALRATLLDYRERMHTNEPVHTWGD